MATKFPKFSQALAQDPATRRIWYGIAAHDLEAHDGMTEEIYIKDFRFTFRSLAVIFYGLEIYFMSLGKEILKHG
jgi:photosystem I P700 chlorophyll a apoprotein A2